MGAPAQDRQHLGGEHQERAGKQRNQRQHVKIEPVGTRYIRAAFQVRIGRHRLRAGGKQGREFTPEAFDIRSGAQAQVNAVDASQPLQAPLRRRDVHDGDPLPVCARRQQSRNLQFDAGSADVDAQRIAGFEAEPVGGGVTQKQCFRIEKIDNRGFHCREQFGLNLRSAKGIESDDPERIVPTGNLRLAFNGRTRVLNLRQPGDTRINGLVETGARPADHQVSFSRQAMDCHLEFVERARVDEMNRDRERDAQCHTEHGQREAPGVFAQRACGYRVDCESECCARHQRSR